RLADDNRARAAGLRDRGGDHRAATEDGAVRAGVRRDVAAGEQARTGDDRAGSALELVEVDAIRVRDEDGVDANAVAPIDEPEAGVVEIRARFLGGERQHARPAGEAGEVR